ncbi:DUF6169 family protein [Flagellimonas sp. CMM7]|uniref:DUF6169 family protein n=1 Tax=Flagellimonas sp. CMM7 TaxID=2654676 RepID=UPI0013D01CEE|nr:DUF6169 family protein [Flagellimonas sp. CMM7]UII80058.1 DUF6169 family protein [Flagellimonas sp. CMM7]
MGIPIIRKISVSVNCKQLPPLDPKVGPTICQILEEYTANHPDELLTYVCDDLDGKGHQRRIKFLRWYEHHSNGSLLALPQEIKSEDQTIYTCLIFDPKVYNEQHIQTAYEEEISLLETVKE